MGHRGKYLLKDVEGTMWLKCEPHIPNTTQTISNNVATAMQDHASLAGCHLNSWHMTSN
jgi:hypothetical protein